MRVLLLILLVVGLRLLDLIVTEHFESDGSEYEVDTSNEDDSQLTPVEKAIKNDFTPDTETSTVEKSAVDKAIEKEQEKQEVKEALEDSELGEIATSAEG